MKKSITRKPERARKKSLKPFDRINRMIRRIPDSLPKENS
jgi:hypothetical protein